MVIPSHVLIHLTQNIKEDYTMEKYIYNNTNGLWYELQGDYYIPCLVLDEEETQPIGMWGKSVWITSRSIAKHCTCPCWSAVN